MMVAKPEIPPSQMMKLNIAKVLLHLDSSHYLDSLYTHMIRTSQVLVYTCICRNYKEASSAVGTPS